MKAEPRSGQLLLPAKSRRAPELELCQLEAAWDAVESAGLVTVLVPHNSSALVEGDLAAVIADLPTQHQWPGDGSDLKDCLHVP